MLKKRKNGKASGQGAACIEIWKLFTDDKLDI